MTGHGSTNVIDYAVANKIEPWLETSYGNPIYEGGGGTNLLNSLMTSPEGYAAYDRWVAAMVTRYKDRVREWEIWNEPDHPMQKITPETIAELNIRTADIIKRIQPDRPNCRPGLCLAFRYRVSGPFPEGYQRQGQTQSVCLDFIPQLRLPARRFLQRGDGVESRD